MDRRTCLKLMGAAGAATVVGPRRAQASEAQTNDAFCILIDLTACVGCRTCEKACAFANELPEPEVVEAPAGEGAEPAPPRDTSVCQWTVVNSHQTSRGEVFVKRQCMHCVNPACAAACLTKALVKTEEGPVIWRESKCMGCRYCMVSCPFDVPRFEYDSPIPKIQKCRMCWDKLQEGESPACVDFCIGEALKFGKRSEMLQLARERVYQDTEKYVQHIYGEREAGGLGVLYLSSVPFEELGFPTNLGDLPMPEYTRNFLTSVPVVLTLFPAFLLGLRRASEQNDEA